MRSLALALLAAALETPQHATLHDETDDVREEGHEALVETSEAARLEAQMAEQVAALAATHAEIAALKQQLSQVQYARGDSPKGVNWVLVIVRTAAFAGATILAVHTALTGAQVLVGDGAAHAPKSHEFAFRTLYGPACGLPGGYLRLVVGAVAVVAGLLTLPVWVLSWDRYVLGLRGRWAALSSTAGLLGLTAGWFGAGQAQVWVRGPHAGWCYAASALAAAAGFIRLPDVANVAGTCVTHLACTYGAPSMSDGDTPVVIILAACLLVLLAVFNAFHYLGGQPVLEVNSRKLHHFHTNGRLWTDPTKDAPDGWTVEPDET